MKHIKIALCICVVAVVVIMPFTAFGAVTEYNSGLRWSDIIEDNNLPVGENYVIWRDTSGFYYIAYQTGNGFEQVTCNAANIADTTALTMPWTSSNHTWKVYKSRSAYNPYGTYSKQNYGYGDDKITFTWTNVAAVMANSRAITNNGTSVFPLAPMGNSSQQGATSPTQTGIYPRRLSLIPTTTFQGVLIEVINILPILLPVLIIFIAIRKGLAFTLTMLRTS